MSSFPSIFQQAKVKCMASISEMKSVLSRISGGLKQEVAKCMWENAEFMSDMVREQIYSGLDGNGKYLNPDYLSDPFFNQAGFWKGRARAYMKWKEKITPPEKSTLLMLPARPKSVPNLFITGPFHRSIHGKPTGLGVSIVTEGFASGTGIVQKYGQNLLGLTETAREYFNNRKLRPRINEFIRKCGYK